LVGKPGGWKPLARPRHRWEENIKMDYENKIVLGLDWSGA
jgi:hypothetical protein